MNEVELEMLFW